MLDNLIPTTELTREPIQGVAIIVAILAVIATIRFINTHKDQWAYAVPPLSWLGHVIIFYACVFIRDWSGHSLGVDFTFWSALIRLQAAVLILGVMGMLAYEKLIFKT